jgi:hypothetical protein
MCPRPDSGARSPGFTAPRFCRGDLDVFIYSASDLQTQDSGPTSGSCWEFLSMRLAAANRLRPDIGLFRREIDGDY